MSLPKYIEEDLIRLAKEKSAYLDDPEFNAYDYCGGNTDDALY